MGAAQHISLSDMTHTVHGEHGRDFIRGVTANVGQGQLPVSPPRLPDDVVAFEASNLAAI